MRVNGIQVCDYKVAAPADRYYKDISCSFRKGSNEILLRVHQHSAFWEAGVELLD